MKADAENTRLREEWTESISRAVGTLRAGDVVMPPADLVGLFDDAMRVHMLDLGPTTEMVDAMERAWWATEDCWELEWADTARCRSAYERWSDSFSAAHERLICWLASAHDGRRDHGAADGTGS